MITAPPPDNRSQAADRRMAGGEVGVGAFGKVTVAALVIVPGPGQTVTFVHQERGPYAGSWLLPGGKVEFGEAVEDAARREALEESGCDVGRLCHTGTYEMRGEWAEGRYHLLMFAFLAVEPTAVPAGFAGHHVGAVRQARPDDLMPHPTVMRILNDARMASYPSWLIEAGLERVGITMACYPSAPVLSVG